MISSELGVCALEGWVTVSLRLLDTVLSKNRLVSYFPL